MYVWGYRKFSLGVLMELRDYDFGARDSINIIWVLSLSFYTYYVC